MKQTICLLVAIVVFSACDNSDLTEDIPVVAGTVAGETWMLQTGKSFRDPVADMLTITLFSTQEGDVRGCSIGSTSNAHLTIEIPNETGSFNIPSGNESLIFHQSGSLDQFQATSGFVEITQIFSNRVVGFLQANFDNENNVEGRFQAEICN